MAIDPICGMQVNEKTGLTLSHEGQTVYFCSAHCREKYAKENKIDLASDPSVCAPDAAKPFYKHSLFQLILLTAVAYLIGRLWAPLSQFSMVLGMYLQKIAVPVTLGLLLGGLIDWLIPREYISLLLARKKKRTIITAVITGFLMTACSHGILAIAMQLYKKGASAPAVVAFLLASPWANLPITILMFGFFGWKAFLIIFSAMLIAILTGWIFMILDHFHWIESNPNTVGVEDGFTISNDIRTRLATVKINTTSFIGGLQHILRGSLALMDMVLGWILIGALLSAVAGAFIPDGFMRAYMGASALGLLVTLLVATVMEICSEGTAPLAFEIYRQTGAFGNAFVFLMAGVATDYTEIGLLWKNIGHRTALWMPAIVVPQVVALGGLFNYLIFKT